MVWLASAALGGCGLGALAGTVPAPRPVTPPAAASVDAGFSAFLAGVRASAVADGIDGASVDEAFSGLTPDPSIHVQAHRQAEFQRPIWDYLDQAVNARRIENGQRIARERAGLLQHITATYGVPGPVVMAIWAMESSYGAILTNRSLAKDVIRSLATLAYVDKQRSAFARAQLVAALKIYAEHDVPRDVFVGSWAGAMGQVQFIPTTFLKFAVDFDGDGRRDIWRSVPDSLASAANYLAKAGWMADRPWGYEVILPAGFDGRLVRRTRSAGQWRALGVKRSHGRSFPREDVALKLILPAGAKGPAFLVTDNFEAIRAYNKSDAYAFAVGLLSDRIAGEPDLEGTWPRKEPPLSQDEREEIQKRLIALGLYDGDVDGRFGGASVSAIRDYQDQHGLPADGWPTRALLAFMRGH